MASEMWQFAAFLGAVALVFLLWLNIIYLPGRTLEQRYDEAEAPRESGREDWEAARRFSGEERGSSGGSEAIPSSSDPTR